MTPDESLKICRLAKALSPAQAVDEYTPDAWAVVLRKVRFTDAEDALAQLGAEQEWIHVSHIVKRVKAMRAERVRRHYANAQPPSGLTDEQYADWQRQTVKAIADGNLEPPVPASVEGHREAVRALGQVQTVDSALAMRPIREAHAEAKRVLAKAEADRKRAEDERRAELERMRQAEEDARK